MSSRILIGSCMKLVTRHACVHAVRSVTHGYLFLFFFFFKVKILLNYVGKCPNLLFTSLFLTDG